MKTRLQHFAVSAALAVLGCSQAHSATIIWTNTAGGRWDTAANWSPNQVPGNADEAVITQSGTYTVLQPFNASVERLRLGGGDGTQTLRVAAGLLTSFVSLTVNSSFTNAGTLELAGADGWSPSLVVNNGPLVNTGLLAVRSGSGGPASLNLTLDNQGTLLVEDQATLENGGRTLANVTGVISVAPNKTLTINGGAIRLDGLSLTGGGRVDLASSIELNLVNDLVLSNQVQLTFGGYVTVNGPGTLQNETVLQLDAGEVINARLDNRGMLLVRNTCTLAGGLVTALGSTVRVEAGMGAGNITFTVNDSFTNAATLELVSAADGWSPSLTVNNGPLVNTGLLAVRPGSGGPASLNLVLDNWGLLSIDADATWAATSAIQRNHGTIALGGGSLTVSQSGTAPRFDNDGMLDAGPGRTVQINGGQFRNNSGGTLQGSGTLDVANTAWSNEGVIRPGQPLGTLTVTGPLPQAFYCTVAIELGGTNSGHFDQIVASGQASLSGELNLRLANGFVPEVGDRFPIVRAATAKGRFTCVHGLNLVSAGIRLEPVYTATGMELVASGNPDTLPRLNLQRVAGQLHICWPAEYEGFTLQSTTNLPPPGWLNLSLTATNRVLFDPAGPEKYYHLVKPAAL